MGRPMLKGAAVLSCTQKKTKTWPCVIVTWKLRSSQLVIRRRFLDAILKSVVFVSLSVTAKALLSKAGAAVLCRVKKINASRERALGRHVWYLSGWTRLS